jgi:hypothetical protein
MTRDEFLQRLEKAGWEFFLTRVPYAEGIRVVAVGAVEVWVVDFFDSGEYATKVFSLEDDDPETPWTPRDLASAFGRLGRAWSEAAADLGVRFVQPFTLQDEAGNSVVCTGLLPDFGGPRGMPIFGPEDSDEVFDLAEAQGYASSGLNPRYYERYDRERFMNTLRDWGWFGEGEPPPWCTPRDG